MPMKRYKPEQIVTLLRQIEVEIANGKTTPQACKEAEITVQTYYRWRKEYGGLKLDQAKRLKELERENAQAEAAGGGAVSGEANSEGRSGGKLLSPERRRGAVRACPEKLSGDGAACLPAAGAVERDTTLRADRSEADEDALTRGDHRAGQ